MNISKSLIFSRTLQENYLGALIVSLCLSSFLPFFSILPKLLIFLISFVTLSLLALIRALLQAYDDLESENEHLSERLRREVLENEKFRHESNAFRIIPIHELEKYDNVIPIHHRPHRIRRVSHK